ncbi:hypothetical protein CDD83_1717 [Cordyceps sp. RAO-2017]|nr:hypothetical protein CDD83_1717 [Cordyceps sp. RAO-2017]
MPPLLASAAKVPIPGSRRPDQQTAAANVSGCWHSSRPSSGSSARREAEACARPAYERCWLRFAASSAGPERGVAAGVPPLLGTAPTLHRAGRGDTWAGTSTPNAQRRSGSHIHTCGPPTLGHQHQHLLLLRPPPLPPPPPLLLPNPRPRPTSQSPTPPNARRSAPLLRSLPLLLGSVSPARLPI